jgi:hypothetical protein
VTAPTAEPTPLVEDPEARGAFAMLFNELYGIDDSVLPLGRVLHWADTARRFGLQGMTINQVPTCVFGGCFYNTSSPAPTAPEIEEILAEGEAKGAQQFLVPTIRNSADTAALRERGFLRIPWVVESIFEIERGLDADLERRVRRHRFRSIEKVTLRAEARYPALFYESADIAANPTVLDTVADLHAHNMAKYQHALNFYSAPLLRRLWTSPLGQHLLFCIRSDATSGEAVQASISLVDRPRRQLYHLVHGIHREKIASGYNLFIATVYQVFAYAERNGITTINLGRGAPQQKLRLGVNRFHLLNNWILNPSPVAEREIVTLASRCGADLGLVGGTMPMIGAYQVE